jgi:proton-translocating NADH-quinone oxidoreductase chain M
LMLLPLLISPLVGCVVLSFIDKTNHKLIQNFSLFWSLVVLNFSFLLLFFFDQTTPEFQFIFECFWLNSVNINLIFGLDGLGLLMILLSSFLIPTCILLCWNLTLKNQIKNYCFAFFFLEFVLFGVFSSLDIMLFYLLFEAVLIPMFLIIGFYGSRERRIRSAYLLFLYTLFSSLIMFLSILFIFFKFGTTDYLILKTVLFDPFSEKLCWFAFFLSFAVKMPLVPFHIWLPEAHCEAPTAGSVILAGILLKLGGFGFLRYSIGLFTDSCSFFAPFVFLISSLGIVYASITTLQQIDLKKIIAYSSVGHMGVVTIGIFSATSQNLIGSIVLMISHGIVSGALFLCIGLLYERHHTRIVKYFAGLLTTMPLFSTFFMVFTMANIGLPGTSSFLGEFLIIAGCIQTNTWVALFSAIGMVLGGSYSLWLLNRIAFGNIKNFSIKEFQDLTRIEFFYLLPYAFLTIVIGIFPEVITCFISFI